MYVNVFVKVCPKEIFSFSELVNSVKITEGRIPNMLIGGRGQGRNLQNTSPVSLNLHKTERVHLKGISLLGLHSIQAFNICVAILVYRSMTNTTSKFHFNCCSFVHLKIFARGEVSIKLIARASHCIEVPVQLYWRTSNVLRYFKVTCEFDIRLLYLFQGCFYV